MARGQESEHRRLEGPVVIRNSEQWSRQIGDGVLSEPVRFIPTHSFSQLFPFSSPDFLLDEYIGLSPIVVFPHTAPVDDGKFMYEFSREKRVRVYAPHFEIAKGSSEGQWEIWAEENGVPIPLGKAWGQGEVGRVSTDRWILPLHCHIAIMGPKTKGDDELLIVEGVAIHNPYESFLTTGEDVMTAIFGIGNLKA